HELGERSQQAVFKATRALRVASTLEEQVLALERHARQYGVLGDPNFLDLYADRRQKLRRAAAMLADPRFSPDVNTLAARVMEEEERTWKELSEAAPASPYLEEVVSGYPALVTLARDLQAASNRQIDVDLLALRAQVESTLRIIMVEGLVLVAAALLLAALFTAFITRPLRQIDRAVRRLGSGSLEAPVEVRGPKDLEELGTRIEWLRTRLAQLEQQRVAFLRHVSHELKTPLTAIQEGVALLNERLVGPLSAQQSEITAILRNQCKRLQRLIEELLLFNINRPATPPSDRRPVRMDHIVDRVISDHSLAAPASRVRFEPELGKITVMGDAEQLRVVVDNLVANAVKYSPQGGTIGVRLGRSGGRAVLEVTDEGPGIPPEERSLVFEAFYQGRPPERDQYPGTGLGLA